MMKMMLRFVLFLIVVLGAALSWAQGLRLSVEKGSHYVGEAMQLTLSAEGKALNTATVVFSPALPVAVVGRQSSINIVNGRRKESSSLVLSATPTEAGTYHLEQLSATTASGEVLTSEATLSIVVTKLETDAAVSIETTVDETSIYVGDRYTLHYRVRVPALKLPQGYEVPFLRESFFGGLERVRPAVRLPALAGMKVLDQQESDRLDGAFYEYTYSLTLLAEQAGVMTFPGLVMSRQSRAVEVRENQVYMQDTYAVGKPFEVTILEAPEAGRPLHWTGAIARTFELRSHVDALNVVVGDPVKLTVDILTDADEKSVRSMPPPKVEGFSFLASPERSPLAEGGVRFVYTFRPTEAGLLEVPALAFGFFDRAEEVYKTVMTPVVPLRVEALPTLFYTFTEGGLPLTEDFPLPLMMTPTPAPRLTVRAGAVWTLVGAVALLLCVLFKGVGWFVLRLVMAPMGWIAPRVWLGLKLRSARSPEEALKLTRTWLKRPSLTPEELERCCDRTEAREVAHAMRQLEAAHYTQQTNEWKAAVKVLLKRLGRLKRWLVLCILLGGVSLQAAPANYAWQQACVMTRRCEVADDFRQAAEAWLTLVHAGDRSKATLLNGAGTAFFAAEPAVAARLVRWCEEAHGADDDTRQMQRAIDRQRGDVPRALTTRLYAWHVRFAFGVRCEGLLVLVAAFLLTFLFRLKGGWMRRVVCTVRWLLLGALLLVGLSVGESLRFFASPLSTALPQVVALEEGGAQ